MHRTEFEYFGMLVGELLVPPDQISSGPIPYDPYRGPGHYDLVTTLRVTSNVPCVVRRKSREALVIVVSRVSEGCIHISSVRPLPRLNRTDWDAIKPIAVAHILLQNAASVVGAPPSRELALEHHHVIRDPALAREHALLLFDRIFADGLIALPRGGFWRDLMRVCEELRLDDRVAACREQYAAALQRVGTQQAPTTLPRPIVSHSTVAEVATGGCPNSSYQFMQTTCCRATVIEDGELHRLYFDAKDLSRSIESYKEGACPLCGNAKWELGPQEEAVPTEWEWACLPRHGRE